MEVFLKPDTNERQTLDFIAHFPRNQAEIAPFRRPRGAQALRQVASQRCFAGTITSYDGEDPRKRDMQLVAAGSSLKHRSLGLSLLWESTTIAVDGIVFSADQPGAPPTALLTSRSAAASTWS